MESSKFSKIIKAFLLEIVFITISSLISLIVYGVLGMLFRTAILKMEGTAFEKIFLILLSIILTIVFVLFLLLFKKKINNRCEKELLEDYKDSEYKNLLEDTKKSFIKREYITLILIFLVNIVALIFENAEILMLWSPMFFFKTVFTNNIVAHIVSILNSVIIYYLFLAVYRRKTYKKWFEKTKNNL